MHELLNTLIELSHSLHAFSCLLNRVNMHIFQTQSKLSQNRIRASIRTFYNVLYILFCDHYTATQRFSCNIATFTCTIIAWFIKASILHVLQLVCKYQVSYHTKKMLARAFVLLNAWLQVQSQWHTFNRLITVSSARSCRNNLQHSRS